MTHDYNRIKGELKRELGTNLKHLQRDKYAYRREYFKRIEEIRLIQKKLWKLIDENQDKPDLARSYLAELNQSTVTLGDLYDLIRNLDQIDNELEVEKPEQTEEPSNFMPSPLPSPRNASQSTKNCKIHIRRNACDDLKLDIMNEKIN